jgi:hypothetical protein
MVLLMQAFDGSAQAPKEGSEPTAAIVSTFVLDGLEPLRVVVHHDDGDWTFACGRTDEAEHFVTVHAEHMFRRFGYDLFHLRGLPPRHVAERDAPGDEWLISPTKRTESSPVPTGAP